MGNPFDFLNSINWTKKDLIREGEMQEGEYKPFLTNRSLSYHVDSIFEANEMNLRSHLPEICQYHFLLHSLTKRKRFAKWGKSTKNESLEIVSRYYQCNTNVAQQYCDVLSKEQIEQIKVKLDMGGVVSPKRR